MSLSFDEIRAVTAEIRTVILGSVLQRVKQPTQDSLVLEFFGREGPHAVLLCTRVGFVRMHFVNKVKIATEYTSGPPGFMMKLRKELDTARLLDMKIEKRDRVVRFIFETPEQNLSLLFEATGHHPNVFLLDTDNIILGSLGANLSRKRDLIAGRPYQWPIPTSKQASDGFRFLDKTKTVNQQVSEYYSEFRKEEELKKRLHDLRRILKTTIQHESYKQVRIGSDLKKTLKADEMYEMAELLKANLPNLRDAERPNSADLRDAQGNIIHTSLDPRMTPAQNMQWMFKRAKALKHGQSILQERMDESQKILKAARALFQEVRLEGAWTRLDELLEQAAALGISLDSRQDQRKQVKPEQQVHKPFKSFRSIHNERILVGKTGQDNDFLTFKIAKDNDYWFHVMGMSGAHVVLVSENRKEVDFESIRDAAMLAAWFSKAKDEGKAEVTYTLRKYVRHAKASKAGTVRVRFSKTILVELQDKRMQRILDTKE